MATKACALCLEHRPLCNSHIVPEFLYAKLYNEKHQTMGIHGRGNDGFGLLQKGLRERLLCKACESLINLKYEIPFRQAWIDSRALPPGVWTFGETRVVRVPYSHFKLFHLSVLYRAAIAKRRTYSGVTLSLDEIIRLRRMILAGDPGPVGRYRIAALAAIHHRSHELVEMISSPQIVSDHGRRFFQMMYGGVEWTIKLSSASHLTFDKRTLNAAGEMPVLGWDWREIPAIQMAGAALRGEIRT